jgi:hypothetical protein
MSLLGEMSLLENDKTSRGEREEATIYLGTFLGSVESITSAPKSLAFVSRR